MTMFIAKWRGTELDRDEDSTDLLRRCTEAIGYTNVMTEEFSLEELEVQTTV